MEEIEIIMSYDDDVLLYIQRSTLFYSNNSQEDGRSFGVSPSADTMFSGNDPKTNNNDSFCVSQQCIRKLLHSYFF